MTGSLGCSAWACAAGAAAAGGVAGCAVEAAGLVAPGEAGGPVPKPACGRAASQPTTSERLTSELTAAVIAVCKRLFILAAPVGLQTAYRRLSGASPSFGV